MSERPFQFSILRLLWATTLAAASCGALLLVVRGAEQYQLPEVRMGLRALIVVGPLIAIAAVFGKAKRRWFRFRVPWLVVGLIGGFATAFVISPLMNTSHERFLLTWGPFWLAGVGVMIGLFIDKMLHPGAFTSHRLRSNTEGGQYPHLNPDPSEN